MSNPAPNGKTYPEEAELFVGFNNDVSEKFTSRIYCVPETVVEAVSGDANTALMSDEIAHHNARPDAAQDPARKGNVLTHLSTKWTLKPFPYKPPPASATHPDTAQMNHKETSEVPAQEKTQVSLAIEYQFANPVYAAMSSAAAPKVAEKMIEAFEKRVKAVFHGPASAKEKDKAEILKAGR
jgi:coenzyme Q-binding protein COQ10